MELAAAMYLLFIFLAWAGSDVGAAITTGATMKASREEIIYLQVRHCGESLHQKVTNGSRRPRPKCIPWPENEPAAHVTHDLHRKRPVSLYNDRSAARSAWAHSMTRNPSLLSCAIEIDNKMPYWFGCRRLGCLFKTLRVHVWILTALTTASAASPVGVARHLHCPHQSGRQCFCEQTAK